MDQNEQKALDAQTRARVECFGIEWNPEDADNCQQCIVQARCRELMAEERIPQVVAQLQKTLDTATDEEIAEAIGTSPLAIQLTRAVILASQTGAAAVEQVRATAKRGRPKKPAELPSAAEPGPNGEPKKSPKSKPKVEASAEVRTPVEVLDGFSLNLTTGQVEQVRWPAFPPLIRVEGFAPILQLVVWCAPLSSWVWIVAKPSNRKLPEGAIELTIEQWFRAGWDQKLGLDATASLQKQIAPG